MPAREPARFHLYVRCALCCCCCCRCCCVCLDTDDERVKSGPVEVLALLPWSAGIRLRETSPGTPSDSSRRSPLPLTLTTILHNAYLCDALPGPSSCRPKMRRGGGGPRAESETSSEHEVRAMARWDPISLIADEQPGACTLPEGADQEAQRRRRRFVGPKCHSGARRRVGDRSRRSQR